MRKCNRRFGACLVALMLLTSNLALAMPVSHSVRAGIKNLPAVSGTTRIDTDESDGIEGEYVLIYNSMTSPSSVESSGLISGISTSAEPAGRSAKSSEMKDYHPMQADPNDVRLYTGRAVDYQVGQKAVFNVQDVRTGQYAERVFEVLASCGSCYVWGDRRETRYPVTTEIAQSMCSEFQQSAGGMIDAFGSFANADGTGKVSIMLYDFGYPYYYGYFSSMDMTGSEPPLAQLGQAQEMPPLPEESEPEESEPEESKPDESKPEESAPDESEPEESKPEESKPGESEPDESKPEESAPDEPNSGESVPVEPAPEDSADASTASDMGTSTGTPPVVMASLAPSALTVRLGSTTLSAPLQEELNISGDSVSSEEPSTGSESTSSEDANSGGDGASSEGSSTGSESAYSEDANSGGDSVSSEGSSTGSDSASSEDANSGGDSASSEGSSTGSESASSEDANSGGDSVSSEGSSTGGESTSSEESNTSGDSSSPGESQLDTGDSPASSSSKEEEDLDSLRPNRQPATQMDHPLASRAGNGAGNCTQMIHINASAMYAGSRPRPENLYSTLVHEFQHMINYSQTSMTGKPSMPLWLNEGLSMAAEEMTYPGSAVPMRLVDYLSDSGGQIRAGKSLYDFTVELDSYAMSCLFTHYLRTQTETAAVFSDIYANYVGDAGLAIEQAVAGSPLEGLSFADMVAAFRIALVVNADAGIYGFRGDSMTASLSTKPYVKDGTSVNLKGGGAVVVRPTASTFIPGAHGSNIRYIGIGASTDGALISNKPADHTMYVLGTHALTGRGLAPLTWSSSNAAVATVDASGLLTALTEGTTTITLANDATSDQFELTVRNGDIRITTKPALVSKDTTTILTAETNPAGLAVAWSVDNPAVATVNQATGALTAVAVGTVKITATIASDPAKIDSFETEVVDAFSFEGLAIDYANKQMDVINSKGMAELAGIVNWTLPANVLAGFSNDGLTGWTVRLTTSVTLEQHDSIGTSATPFRGTFLGQDQVINLKSIDVPQGNEGVFGVNGGTLQDVNVVVDGVIGAARINNVGAVCGYNFGTIKSPTVINLHGSSIQAANCVGGIAGKSHGGIEDAFVTNFGEIVTLLDPTVHVNGNPVGGVVGFIERNGPPGARPYLRNATVYNYGLIRGDDDIGAVVGLSQSPLQGNYDVLIGEGASVTGGGSRSASVGGVVGLAYYGGVFAADLVRLRIDGAVVAQGGSFGGVIGEGDIEDRATIIVTLGPNGSVTSTSGTAFLIQGEDAGSYDQSKWVYAVPYDSPYKGAPPSEENWVRRIEYPVSPADATHLPPTPIQVDMDNPRLVVNASKNVNTPNGIFINKKDAPVLTSLEMESAVDDEIFVLDVDNQLLRSKYSAPNYFDFNLNADGYEIVVPAYLDLTGPEQLPSLVLAINGTHVAETEQLAVNNPCYTKEDITITARNGRIVDWTLERAGLNYKNRVSVNPNDSLNKGFFLTERGIYKITATGRPLDGRSDGTDDVTITRWVCIGAIPIITLEGEHLTVERGNEWTNLASQASGRSDIRKEEVTIEALATEIQSYEVKKEGMVYRVHPDELNPDEQTLKKFPLYETGRYQVAAKGVDVPQPITKYVNIDVDAPEKPRLSIAKARQHTALQVEIPMEPFNQSPVHLEYKLDNGGFTSLTGWTAPISAGASKLTLRIVDKARNVSPELVLYQIRTEAQPPQGGSVSDGGWFEDDTPVTIDAQAYSGYTFTHWTDPAGTRISDAVHVLMVNGGGLYTAHFTQQSSPPVNPPDDDPEYVILRYMAQRGGSIVGANYQKIPRYSSGSLVQAVAREGYTFKAWSDGVTSAARRDLRVEADILVYAIFEPTGQQTVSPPKQPTVQKPPQNPPAKPPAPDLPQTGVRQLLSDAWLLANGIICALGAIVLCLYRKRNGAGNS